MIAGITIGPILAGFVIIFPKAFGVDCKRSEDFCKLSASEWVAAVFLWILGVIPIIFALALRWYLNQLRPVVAPLVNVLIDTKEMN